MAYFDDANELVSHAKNALPRLEQDYQASLDEMTVKPVLLIDIKNIMENLRSALDFSAHGLFNKYGASTKANPKVYFPYAVLGQNQAAFQAANRIENCIQGITAARPDIVARRPRGVDPGWRRCHPRRARIQQRAPCGCAWFRHANRDRLGVLYV
jgi:hypothetical protein